ncbi:MAG: 4Fe-4S binding protein [Candidatus Omnitrophica bacterium]|nr:4Fe-4S binding protein [Candidatus Omnitrophota bacterium]
MKRKIIEINADICNGCGLCIPNCPEGAIQIIDNKARLVSDLFCDGLGACLGHCPEGAITVTEREAAEYDEKKVMDNVVKGGDHVIKAHLEHLESHAQEEFLKQAKEYLRDKNIEIKEEKQENIHTHAGGSGCPGMKIMDFGAKNNQASEANVSVRSELTQWPIQLKLLNPQVPFFDNSDIVIAADGVPFAYANFHQKFLKGKKLIIFCPKLDDAYEEYVTKLTAIFKNNNIKSITIVHMEVPCCSGTVHIVKESLKKSGKNIEIKDYTISLKGELI